MGENNNRYIYNSEGEGRMKKIACITLCLVVTLLLQGCGETFRGIGKDIGRIGRGVKTVFVSDYQ